MNQEARQVRQYLKDCSRTEYEQLVYEAKLTISQANALQYCIADGKSLLETAEVMNCSGRTISKLINQAYNKIVNMKK